MTHLFRHTFGEENVAWCGEKTYADMQENPEESDCLICLDNAAKYGVRAERTRVRILFPPKPPEPVDDLADLRRFIENNADSDDAERFLPFIDKLVKP